MDQMQTKINEIRYLLASAKMEIRRRSTYNAFKKFDKIEGLIEAIEEEYAAKAQQERDARAATPTG